MIMIWGLRSADDPAHNAMCRRARILFDLLKKSEATIVVPTIVVGELLAGIDQKKHGAFLASLKDHFHCPPYDLHASALAAQIWQKHRQIEKADQISRTILKSDVMILASMKAAGASVFYSNDAKCRQLASHFMEARDLPTHSEQLFEE